MAHYGQGPAYGQDYNQQQYQQGYQQQPYGQQPRENFLESPRQWV